METSDRIDVLALFEHLAVVFVLRDIRILLESFGGAIVVGIAQRDDILLRATCDIGPPLSAGADGGDVELLVGRSAGRPHGLPRNPNRRAQGGRLFHEFASRCLSFHVAPCACGLPSTPVKERPSIMPRRPGESQLQADGAAIHFHKSSRWLELKHRQLPIVARWPSCYISAPCVAGTVQGRTRMRQQYRRQSFSAWVFWGTLIVGGTLLRRLSLRLVPHRVFVPRIGPAGCGVAKKSPGAEKSPTQAPPDGQIEVAQSPAGPQSEPPPSEFDEPAAGAKMAQEKSTKARLLEQRAGGAASQAAAPTLRLPPGPAGQRRRNRRQPFSVQPAVDERRPGSAAENLNRSRARSSRPST